MQLKDVLTTFNSWPDLPVPVDSVLSHIRSAGIVDRLQIIEVDTDVALLRGMFVREHRSGPVYSPALDCADILVSKNQPNDWRRVVCVKEALHVFDSALAETNSIQTIRALLKTLALPPAFYLAQQAAASASAREVLGAFQDRCGEWIAAAVLFPLDARAEFGRGLASGALTEPEISKIVNLPLRYVSAVMSDDWLNFYQSLDHFLNNGIG